MVESRGRILVPTELPFDYSVREPETTPRELILLLHGYSESGSRIFRKLSSVMPEDCVILAPSALFPFAQAVEERYRLGHSWYFYNFQTDEYVVDMNPALQFLEAGIAQLGYTELPLRIIGFSQGGYLAPFLGCRLKKTIQVVGVCSTYLEEELPAELRFRADNVVGRRDTVVDPINSRRAHAEILKRSRGGEFSEIDTDHRIDEKVASKVGELIQLPLV